MYFLWDKTPVSLTRMRPRCIVKWAFSEKNSSLCPQYYDFFIFLLDLQVLLGNQGFFSPKITFLNFQFFIPHARTSM